MCIISMKSLLCQSVRRKITAQSFIFLLVCQPFLSANAIDRSMPHELRLWLDSAQCAGTYTTPTDKPPSAGLRSLSIFHQLKSRSLMSTTYNSREAYTSNNSTAITGTYTPDLALQMVNDLYEVEGDLALLSQEIDNYVNATGTVPLTVDSIIQDVLGGGRGTLTADRVRTIFDRFTKVVVLMLCIELPLFYGDDISSTGTARRKLASSQVATEEDAEVLVEAMRRLLGVGENDWRKRGVGILFGLGIALALGAVVTGTAPVLAPAIAGMAARVLAPALFNVATRATVKAVGSVVVSVAMGAASNGIQKLTIDTIANRATLSALKSGDCDQLRSALSASQGLAEGNLPGSLYSSLSKGMVGSFRGGIKQGLNGLEWYSKREDPSRILDLTTSYNDIYNTYKDFEVPNAGDPSITQAAIDKFKQNCMGSINGGNTENQGGTTPPLPTSGEIDYSCIRQVAMEFQFDTYQYSSSLEGRCLTAEGRLAVQNEWIADVNYWFEEGSELQCRDVAAGDSGKAIVYALCVCKPLMLCHTLEDVTDIANRINACLPCEQDFLALIPAACRSADLPFPVHSFLPGETLGEHC